MDQVGRLEVYRAQVRNVRSVERALASQKRSINDAIRKNDHSALAERTKMLVIIFRSWSEAHFSKMIHTPHGFTLAEIAQIKSASTDLHQGWLKALQLGLKKVPAQKSGFANNVKQKIERVIKTYIAEPYEIRNKLAHGQWVEALNRQNTSKNDDITERISSIDIVQIDIWIGVNRGLGEIIESLIESPDRTFVNNYWTAWESLRDFIAKTDDWTLENKRRDILAKAARKPV